MCGIIGYTGQRPAIPVLVEGLRRLEYRGYDSAGIAWVQSNKLEVLRAAGKLSALEEKLSKSPNFLATVGIGHTRWATHGVPAERNSHPHLSNDGQIALVHNGIIENFQELKEELLLEGYTFSSETDTEVFANIIAKEVKKSLENLAGIQGTQSGTGADTETASTHDADIRAAIDVGFRNALNRAQGAYALAMICMDTPHILYAARNNAPLLLGIGTGETFIASDIPAFLTYTRDVVFLEDGELAIIENNHWNVYDVKSGVKITKEIQHITWDIQAASKDGYKHYMLKEIMEQPKVIRDCLLGRVENGMVNLPELTSMEIPKRLRIVACGTSYNAGLWARSYLEQLANIPVEVEIASEFRYRKPCLDPNEIILVISQSGETADTLGALRLAKSMGLPVLGLCNVLGSSLAREADLVIYTHAGPEISVASTKAMLSQMLMLLLMALYFGQRRNLAASESLATDKSLTAGKKRIAIINELLNMPDALEKLLPSLHAQPKKLAQK